MDEFHLNKSKEEDDLINSINSAYITKQKLNKSASKKNSNENANKEQETAVATG